MMKIACRKFDASAATDYGSPRARATDYGAFQMGREHTARAAADGERAFMPSYRRQLLRSSTRGTNSTYRRLGIGLTNLRRLFGASAVYGGRIKRRARLITRHKMRVMTWAIEQFRCPKSILAWVRHHVAATRNHIEIEPKYFDIACRRIEEARATKTVRNRMPAPSAMASSRSITWGHHGDRLFLPAKRLCIDAPNR